MLLWWLFLVPSILTYLLLTFLSFIHSSIHIYLLFYYMFKFFYNDKKKITKNWEISYISVKIHRKLKGGIIPKASKKFCCSINTIKRIWLQAQSIFTRGLPVDVLSNLKGRVGRKRVQLDRTEVSQVLLQRQKYMSKSTLHR